MSVGAHLTRPMRCKCGWRGSQFQLSNLPTPGNVLGERQAQDFPVCPGCHARDGEGLSYVLGAALRMRMVTGAAGKPQMELF